MIFTTPPHKAFIVKRIAQDEVHVICRDCDFKHAIPLGINNRYDGKGYTVNKTEHDHNIRSVFNTPPPTTGKRFL